MPLRHMLTMLILLAALPLPGCDRADDAAMDADDTFRVYVVNHPLQYMAERIAGDAAEVHLPLPAGAHPRYWQPEPATIQRYQQADLVLLNGARYARWVGRASLPGGVVVDTAAGFRDRLLEVPDAVVHSHGDGPAHAHAGVAAYTWLDPSLAIEHGRAIRDALAQRLPEHADAFGERFDALAAELAELDDQLAELSARHGDVPLLAARPVYHYLARAHGLDITHLQWQRGRTPTDREWDALDEMLEARAYGVMLWPEALPAEVAQRLERRGLRVVVFETADAPANDADLLQRLRANLDALGAALDAAGETDAGVTSPGQGRVGSAYRGL